MDNFLLEHGVYQIYPISFKDSNNDGKGDINGIISKLDYLKEIGIDIIWLSPIYLSPMLDMGYDVADYKKINPIFGTMEDFDNLIKETKKREMRVIMDLVVNHTSSEHFWFKDALNNPDSKYRKYYYFEKGKEGKYPNNWTSTFGGPAWEKVPNEDNMYYLHLYSKYQPDLNFHSEELIKEVEDILSFWLNKGVYGFRCDVISSFYKTSLADGKKQGLNTPIGIEHYIGTKENLEILKRFRKNVIDPKKGVMIGEFSFATIDNIQPFVNSGVLDTFFSFDHVNINQVSFKEMVNPKKLKKVLINWQTKVINNGVYFENHDQHRVLNKYVKKGYEKPGSKMILTLIYSLKGVPFIYMGQEIGSYNYPKNYFKFEETNDIVCHTIYDAIKKIIPFKSIRKKFAMHITRDDERAPMAFTPEKGFGFTSGEISPWQKYNPMSKIANVESQNKDKNSTLHFFKKIIDLRKNLKVLSYGDISFLNSSKTTLIYTRKYEKDNILVIINLSNKKQNIQKYIKNLKLGKIIISNYEDDSKILRPYEAKIYSIS